ncbi:NAD(P)-dependent alcohol dehydrogenase [Myxococcus sp. K15C18031901]|uniref:NAD(P)-dependent alcohol dehydrogenase n=1 Tax=Myxococcus dinghuensis TaxID=2906761 RepID=UPI0020A81A09|nr:NAD(P)-dependent alcohol dehydrogenase [Myxococcus dinghuensis]MCP3103691.1 NAD(P)-dependent alcohol dehydrogenase [Myxococcus dinghuensis]
MRIENRPEDRQDDENENQEVGRRGFILSGALAAVSAGVGTLVSATPASAHAAPGAPPAPGQGPFPVEGMAAYSPTGGHKPLRFQRRALGPKDVAIKLHFCGICHSDIHTVRGDWGPVPYPLITGHELAGEVVAVGSSVSKFKVGSRVGVGCIVDSCGHCSECAAGFEQYCENGMTQVYGSKDRDGTMTQGGYSTFNVVNEDYVLNVPSAIDLAEAGPLMCAGITVYSPLRRWSAGPGKRVGIIGLGGLGHLATQIAKAMGAEVTVFTTTPGKAADARRFGAKEVVVVKEGGDLAPLKRKFDFILDTSPYRHDIDLFIPLLRRDATMCIVGVGKFTEPTQYGPVNLVLARNSLAGSCIGGIRETQELIDFCALHGIRPAVTKIGMGQIDDAWAKVVAKQARYRFVVDVNKA